MTDENQLWWNGYDEFFAGRRVVKFVDELWVSVEIHAYWVKKKAKMVDDDTVIQTMTWC